MASCCEPHRVILVQSLLAVSSQLISVCSVVCRSDGAEPGVVPVGGAQLRVQGS